ncbi:CHC2 zinc finger domain-containing protein [Streptomyces sp. enrichment culture]|uniref:CHC2 zinc finger domain-containing protein n=1 Tax=Streptomyces sp. enrichment culture TaxID=1795815 RepID=UPI003F576D71
MGAYGPSSRRTPAQGSGIHLIPLAPILAHYGVDLNEGRWGNELVCCPIHGERRASMSVSVEKGVFHCFACGAGGTAVTLVQMMESCDRADAQRRAEEILRASGIDVRERSRGRYQRPGVSGEPGARAQRSRYVPPGRRS